MNIDDLTLGNIKKLQNLFAGQSASPVEIGKAYVFRTVTMIDIGVVAEVMGNFVRLDNAAWIPSTSRWMDFLKSGSATEIEPFPAGCWLNLDTVVDIAPWAHSTDWKQK